MYTALLFVIHFLFLLSLSNASFAFPKSSRSLISLNASSPLRNSTGRRAWTASTLLTLKEQSTSTTPHQIGQSLYPYFISYFYKWGRNSNITIKIRWTKILRKCQDQSIVLECPGRPVYFLISTLGRSSQSTVKSSLLCPGRLDFIFSVHFYIFGHLDPSFLAPGYVFIFCQVHQMSTKLFTNHIRIK
jgi:hypothetical protein